MATIFKLNHLGAEFSAKIIDADTGGDFNVNDVVEQFIVFTKPDGPTFEKTAILVEDPVSSGIFFVRYTNTAPETESILDLIGNWAYAAKVKLNNNDEFETFEESVFWVV